MSSSSDRPPRSFQHQTSSATPRYPFIDTSTQAINATPVELDSTPVSPVATQQSWGLSKAAEATTAGAERRESKPGSRKDDGLDRDGSADGASGEEQDSSQQERRKREALLKERSQDPAVVVDVPEEPGADELAVTEEDHNSRTTV